MQSHIDLIIPGLCGPLPDISGLHDNEALSRFVSLISKTSKHAVSYRAYPEQLCSSMGLCFDPIPLAEFSLSAYGIDKQGFYWMHADPVHMMADVDHLVLYDSNSLNLTLDEADALLAELNRHFKQDGIEFVLGDAEHWFVRSERPFDVATRRLNDAVMRNVNQLMPVGKGEVFCKQLLNESQMLLYSNPVNEKRDANGLLTANSLWLWGEGSLEGSDRSNVSKCFGDDVLLKGMSNHLGIVCEDVISPEAILSGIKNNDKSVVVFNDLLTACSYGDVSSWLDSFDSLHERLIEPFISHALKSNLEIHCYPCNGYRYVIDSKAKYRFWRKRDMEDYFEANH